MPRFELLVLGDANPDLVLTGDVEPVFGQAERLVDDARLTIGIFGLAILKNDMVVAAGEASSGFESSRIAVVRYLVS